MNSSSRHGMTRRETLVGASVALLAAPALAQQSPPGRPVYAYVRLVHERAAQGALAEDGALRDKTQLVELKGTPGPHRVRQVSSHPHDIVFDPSGRFVVVPDLGLDRTFVFRFDPASGQLTEASSLDGRPTSGPRHVAFHPTRPIMWILNELDSTMTTCQWDGERGALRPVQIISTLRTGYTGNSTAAELAVVADGRLRLCIQPRRRRHLRLFRGPGHGRADFGGVGAEPGQGSALHRPHALRALPLCRQ